MKILILTSCTTANVYLVNYLTERKPVVAKVIEKRYTPSSYREKMDIRKQMLKKYGVFKTLNKLLYNKYRQYFMNQQHADAMKRQLFPESSDVAYRKDIPTIEVENINDRRCLDFIIEHKPDIIAVCGTTVIKPALLQLADKGIINIHCGITPEYRSADPIFWALYNNEPDRIGVTIHSVDEGIDTGPILYQEAVDVTGDDDLATLYCKCIKKGAELMSQAISNIEAGERRTIRKEGVTGKAYYHMDLGIWQYLVFRRRFGNLLKSYKSSPLRERKSYVSKR